MAGEVIKLPPMPEFASLDSYWKFEKSVKAKAKCGGVELLQGDYDEETREFLRMVLETSRIRCRKISKGRVFFRAQNRGTWTTAPLRIGEEEEAIETEDVVAAHPPERMVPKAEKVSDGRLNRKGIPCLYLASTPSAAMSEMRPWVGSYITLARFKMMRDCRVVDCSLNTTISGFLEVVRDGVGDPGEPDALTKEAGIWGDIGFACSKPVTHDEPRLDYIPTQILADAFHNYGYRGIVYKSLLDDPGLNIALFDVNAAKPIGCCLYQTKSASLEFARSDDNLAWPESIESEFRRGKAFTVLAPSRENDSDETAE
jgi:hypothetical protein